MSDVEVKNENEEVEIAVADDSAIDDDQFDLDPYIIKFAIKENMPEMIDYFTRNVDQRWRVNLYSHDSHVFIKAFRKAVKNDSVRDFLAHLDRFLIFCPNAFNKIAKWVILYKSEAILRVMVENFCHTPSDKRASSDNIYHCLKMQTVPNIQPKTDYYQSHIDGFHPSIMSKKQFVMRAASSTQDD